MSKEEYVMKKVLVDESKCIRCGACMQVDNGKLFGCGPDGESVPLVEFVEDDNKEAIVAMEGCPTGAITLDDVDDCKCENCDCEDCDCEGCDCDPCECDNCDCNHKE